MSRLTNITKGGIPVLHLVDQHLLSRLRPIASRGKFLAPIALSLLLAFEAGVMTSRAQQLTADIKGTVTDATGAGVPDAQVTATNTQTQVAQTSPSKSDGSFEFLQLPIGVYSVTVVKPGFSKFAAENIQLAINQTYTLAVKLQVGSVNSTIEVTEQAAQVETSTTQLDTVVEAQKIVDLPLNGRNWVQLQQLAPGVVSTSDRFSSNYATNGSESQQNSFLINGADAIDLPLNTPLVIPSPDAIGEFNLITSTINPEYGRNSGGILNAVIKSGTNAFHGDAFEFYRDTFLNGRNLYQTAKPIFHQNQYGGTVGGPLWKDHTFFFLSYQGTRNRQPEAGASNTTSVFTPDQRNGIFPDVASSTATSPFPLVGENGTTYPAGTPYSTIFPTGHIPNADFNPLSAKLLAGYVPLPNSPGGLFSFNPISTNHTEQGIMRFDHNFSPADSLWFTMLFNHNISPETLPFTGATLPGFGDESTSSVKLATGDWTHTFNPTTVNELRLSYLRLNFVAVEPQTPVLPSSAGFAITPQDAAGAGLPFIGVTGFFSLGFSTNGPQPRIDETYEAADNFSKVHGHHTWKFGFDGKRYNVDNPFFGTNNGSYSFGGSGLYSTGDPGADFMLGIPDSYTQGSGGWIVARTYEYYMYAQDTWKVNDHLTLNYGTGYQIDTPLVNLHFGKLDLNCFAPGQQSSVFPSAPTGLLFPGDKGCTQSGYYPHYGHFGPRFGFAYSPSSESNPSTVIRGGFGVYYNRSEEELALQNLGAVPFSLTSVGAASVSGFSPAFANPFMDIAGGGSVPNPFPFAPPTKGSNVDFTQFYPMSINVINPNFTSPYAMNYNLNIQRQLPGAFILQLAYVGAVGRHLEITYEGNPISPAGAAACAADPACIADRVNQHVDYPSHALYAPGNIFASIGTQGTLGNSNYNSFQVRLQKNLTHGLSLLASYTWGHSIDDTSGFENSGFGSRGEDPYNFALERGDSSFDARQRLVVTYDYEIPHLSQVWNSGFVRAFFDGWHIAGITTLQSGLPITVFETNFRSLQCDGFNYYGCWDEPNAVSFPTSYDPRTSVLVNSVRGGKKPKNYYYFNPNAFALEALGTLGNEGRNNFHGPGINNTDLDLAKRIYVDREEKRFLELRLEGYNVFNHTQFQTVSYQGSGVNGNAYSSNFGRVLSAASGRTVQLGVKFYF
jgi:hypothetical protein